VRRSRVASTVVLVIGSAIFYAWRTVWWLAPLIVAATVDYIVGMKMSGEGAPDHVRRRWLILSLVVNLGLLGTFKYLGWLTLSINELLGAFGIAASLPVIALTLPPGISFYTFETMSYTIDVYRRHYKTERSFLVYLNFVLFFPHLVAGPILRPGDLIGQLKVVRPVATAVEVREALCLIFWGLFKKIVFADNFGDLVEFSAHNDRWEGMGILYALAFTFQIYCDFSAYTDIARGSALLFGIKLPRNFMTPLFALSPQEFWRRWHITLSTWIRDYVYIPLGGNHGTVGRQAGVMMLTMGLAGLWHGAGMMFILWGLYHGVLILIYRLPPARAFLRWSERGNWRTFVAWAVFFALTVFGWMMFRAGSGTPGEFERMAGNFINLPAIVENPQYPLALRQLALLALPILGVEFVAWRRNCEFPDVLSRLGTLPLATILTAMWFVGVVFAKRSSYDFIYFAF
jgi:D-alanyl-lipoteichoic acid acyltransferase DltB (MBOAT superfamily)